MSKLDEIAGTIKLFLEGETDTSLDLPVTVDDVGPDDWPPSPAIGEEALTFRIGYGGGELYDIYVVRV